MARINSRVQRSNGPPLPPSPRKRAAPASQTSSNIAINEAKSIPDSADTHLAPASHPAVTYDGSGGRAHRVQSGVPR